MLRKGLSEWLCLSVSQSVSLSCTKKKKKRIVIDTSEYFKHLLNT